MMIKPLFKEGGTSQSFIQKMQGSQKPTADEQFHVAYKVK